MRTIAKTLLLAASAAAVSAPSAARAEGEWFAGEPQGGSPEWPNLKTGFGVSTIFSGGITGFTDKTLRDAMPYTVGGLWGARATIGTHVPLGFDIGYVGMAGKLDALSGSTWGTLVGTTLEGALRWNILPHYAFNPYAFVGMGWQRYDITGATFRMADTGMNQSDNSIIFPMGAGISYRDKSGLVLDVHGTFRANTYYGLVGEGGAGGTSYVPMHSWEAAGALGYEF